MPLIRRDCPAGDSAPEADYGALLAELASPEEETRWRAARGLGQHRQAAPALGQALAREPAPNVRQALFTSLVRIGGNGSAEALLPYLRSEDARLRGGAIEALQTLPPAVLLAHFPALLRDADPDVRILSCELLRGMPPKEATGLLAGVVDGDPHVNVCGAAVDVLAEIGTRDAAPALERCVQRFAGDPFLPFAARIALARVTAEPE